MHVIKKLVLFTRKLMVICYYYVNINMEKRLEQNTHTVKKTKKLTNENSKINQ